MKKFSLLFLALATLSSATQNDRMQVNLNTDDNGNTNPDLFIPLYWSPNLFSGVGYTSSSRYETGNVNGGTITDSSIGTTTEERSFKLNILTYEVPTGGLTYALGGDFEKISIEKHEFGYLDYTTDISAVENNIEIDVTKVNLNADMTYKNSDLYARLGVSFSPSGTLAVKQDTTINPLVTGRGTSDSTNSLDPSYDISFKAGYKLSPLATLIAQGNHNRLPLKYDLATAVPDGSGGLVFDTSEMDTVKTTTKSMLKLAFNLDSFSKELSPSIGYGSETVETLDNDTDKTESSTNSYWMIGFEGRF